MIRVNKAPSTTEANEDLNVDPVRPNDLLAAILD